jgi:hypothetical protein
MAPVLCPLRSLGLKVGVAEVVLRQETFARSVMCMYMPRLWSAFLAANMIQEADLQFLHTEDMSNGPISLGDNDDYGPISRRSSPCISTKSLPLDESGYPSDGSTPCSTDSPHTSSHAPSNQNTLNDLAPRMRSESFPMSDSLVDGVSGRLLADKQHSPRHEPDLPVAGPTVRHDLDHSAGGRPMHIPFLAKGILGIRKQEIMKFSILSIHRLTIYPFDPKYRL